MQQMDVPFLKRRKNTMKRLAILHLICLMAFSCNSSSSDDPTGPSEVFQGTFVVLSMSIDGGDPMVPPAVTGTLTVRPDNTFTVTINAPDVGVNNETSSGTWERNGNQFTITDDDGTVSTATVTPDENQLTVIETEEGATITIVFVRS